MTELKKELEENSENTKFDAFEKFRYRSSGERLDAFLKRRWWVLHIISLSTGITAIIFSVRILIHVFFMMFACIILMRGYVFFSQSRLFRKIFVPKRIQFTREGVFFIVIAIAIGAAAINTGTNLLYLILAMMLSIIITSGILSEMNFRRITFTRHLPSAVFAKEPFTIEIVVRNDKRRSSTFSLDVAEAMGGKVPGSPMGGSSFVRDRLTVTALSVAPGGKEVLSYRGALTKRGIAQFNTIEISSAYPFNFLIKTMKTDLPAKVVVYPEVRPVREDMLITNRWMREIQSRLALPRRGEDEFHGLREFRPGDSYRKIHWKSSAKASGLLVREYEERRTDRMAVVIETFSGSKSFTEGKFERGAILAASILTHYLRKGFEIGLYGCLPRPRFLPPERGRHQYFRLLDALGRMKPSSRRTLADFAEQVPAADVKDVVLFVVRLSETDASREGLEILKRRAAAVVDVPVFAGNFDRVLETADAPVL